MGPTKIYIQTQSYTCNLPRIKVLFAFETKPNPYLFHGFRNFVGSVLQESSKGVRNLACDFPPGTGFWNKAQSLIIFQEVIHHPHCKAHDSHLSSRVWLEDFCIHGRWKNMKGKWNCETGFFLRGFNSMWMKNLTQNTYVLGNVCWRLGC